jgi:hypothetical protein
MRIAGATDRHPQARSTPTQAVTHIAAVGRYPTHLTQSLALLSSNSTQTGRKSCHSRASMLSAGCSLKCSKTWHCHVDSTFQSRVREPSSPQSASAILLVVANRFLLTYLHSMIIVQPSEPYRAGVHGPVRSGRCIHVDGGKRTFPSTLTVEHDEATAYASCHRIRRMHHADTLHRKHSVSIALPRATSLVSD